MDELHSCIRNPLDHLNVQSFKKLLYDPLPRPLKCFCIPKYIWPKHIQNWSKEHNPLYYPCLLFNEIRRIMHGYGTLKLEKSYKKTRNYLHATFQKIFSALKTELNSGFHKQYPSFISMDISSNFERIMA